MGRSPALNHLDPQLRDAILAQLDEAVDKAALYANRLLKQRPQLSGLEPLDVVDDALAPLFQERWAWKPDNCKLVQWLCKQVFGLIVEADKKQRSQPRNGVPFEVWAKAECCPSSSDLNAQKTQEIMRALQDQPKWRQLAEMIVDDVDTETIARRLDVAKEEVYRMKSEMIEHLRRILGSEK